MWPLVFAKALKDIGILLWLNFALIKKRPKHTENDNSHLSLDALGPGVEKLQENIVVTRSQHPPWPTGGRALETADGKQCVFMYQIHTK